MTEKQKMKIWKYASQTNYKSECFRDDYSENLEIMICNLVNKKLTQEGWQGLWNKYKTDPYDSSLCFKLLAMVQNESCPTNIVEEIIEDIRFF